MVADSSAGRGSPDENDGEGHSCRVVQLLRVPAQSQENLRIQRCYWELVRIVLPRNEF